MKPKLFFLEDGTVIIDGFSKLLVIDRELSYQIFDHENPERKRVRDEQKRALFNGVPCKAAPFTTKSGRAAIKVMNGNSHILRFYEGGPDRGWGDWDNRQIVNGLFSEAKAITNGGGWWLEVEIYAADVRPISAEEKYYLDEMQ